jgi:hypothetical protein
MVRKHKGVSSDRVPQHLSTRSAPISIFGCWVPALTPLVIYHLIVDRQSMGASDIAILIDFV